MGRDAGKTKNPGVVEESLSGSNSWTHPVLLSWFFSHDPSLYSEDVVFRSREVANIRMTQQYRINIAQLNTTKDSRNSDK